MAQVSDLVDRLYSKFKHVSDVDEDDVKNWVKEAALAHGYSADKDPIKSKHEQVIMLYAQATGYETVALQVADYFKYRDGEDEVDKTKVPENYRKLAQDLWERYENEKSKTPGIHGGSSSFTIMKRPDRPIKRWRRGW